MVMKAFVTQDPAASTIRLAEVAVPRVGADELLVRLQAVGVGIHDSSFLPPDAGDLFPIGVEGAGVVEEVGAASWSTAPATGSPSSVRCRRRVEPGPSTPWSTRAR